MINYASYESISIYLAATTQGYPGMGFVYAVRKKNKN